MSSSEAKNTRARLTVRFARPLRGLALARPPGTWVEPGELERREQAAAAHARAEAAEVFNRQILEQRQEVQHLQSTVLDNIAAESAQLLDEFRARLPDLVVALARRVLAGFEPDRETVVAIVDEAVCEASPAGEQVNISLCPEDLELLRGEGGVDLYPGFTFQANPALARGDCIVRSRFGLLDARVETKLKKMEAELCQNGR